jgi:hypothetical protein
MVLNLQGSRKSKAGRKYLSENGFTEQKRGKEGGGLGAGNWGLWFPPPDGWLHGQFACESICRRYVRLGSWSCRWRSIAMRS